MECRLVPPISAEGPLDECSLGSDPLLQWSPPPSQYQCASHASFWEALSRDRYVWGAAGPNASAGLYSIQIIVSVTAVTARERPWQASRIRSASRCDLGRWASLVLGRSFPSHMGLLDRMLARQHCACQAVRALMYATLRGDAWDLAPPVADPVSGFRGRKAGRGIGGETEEGVEEKYK